MLPGYTSRKTVVKKTMFNTLKHTNKAPPTFKGRKNLVEFKLHQIQTFRCTKHFDSKR